MGTTLAGTPLVERITQLVRDGDVELPAYPEVAHKVRELIEDEHTEPRQVAELLGNEPALATEVLRIANSAAYGGLNPITDVRQAVTRLGLRQVASIVTALAVERQYRSGSPERRGLMRALWGHAVATALAARFLARRAGVDADEAFLAGLLHDTGKLLVLRALDVMGRDGAPEQAPTALVDELMRALHPRLGYDALTAWKVPEGPARVALHHHDEAADGKDLLLLCVQAANLIARKAGFHPHPGPDLDLLCEPAVEQLGLMDLSLATLLVELEDELERKHRLFGATRTAA